MKKQKMAALITCILVVGLAGVWHCVVQKSSGKGIDKVGFVYIGDEVTLCVQFYSGTKKH